MADDLDRRLPDVGHDEAVSPPADRWLAELNASFERSIAELDAGGGHDADKVFDALDAKYTAAIAADAR